MNLESTFFNFLTNLLGYNIDFNCDNSRSTTLSILLFAVTVSFTIPFIVIGTLYEPLFFSMTNFVTYNSLLVTMIMLGGMWYSFILPNVKPLKFHFIATIILLFGYLISLNYITLFLFVFYCSINYTITFAQNKFKPNFEGI